MIRVAVADDQELVRAGLRMILEGEADFEVVGEAAEGEEAIRLAGRQQPDVLLLDVRMPGMDGFEAARRVLSEESSKGVRVLMLTTFDLGGRPVRRPRDDRSPSLPIGRAWTGWR